MSKIKKLIVVAGPAASGKTFLLNRIKKGLCPHLYSQLGITDPADWHFANVWNTLSTSPAVFDKLIVHYDMYDQRNGKKVHQLLLRSEQITVLDSH
jgi:GTPase SAR1 family protein